MEGYSRQKHSEQAVRKQQPGRQRRISKKALGLSDGEEANLEGDSPSCGGKLCVVSVAGWLPVVTAAGLVDVEETNGGGGRPG